MAALFQAAAICRILRRAAGACPEPSFVILGSGLVPCGHPILPRIEIGGAYFAAISLQFTDVRNFPYMREIVKICPRSPIVSLSNT